MARRIGVEIVGDATNLERTYRRAARDTSRFTREIERAGRGALAGSRIFHGFGRSLAFASGGFVAFEGASAFLRETIDAARDAAVSQRSLSAQMKASGESFTDNKARIEELATSYERFGFQNDEVIKSLTVLERGTGSLNEAMNLQQLTADLARAKGVDLASAAQTVAKVFGGQETALRRAVPGLRQNAHGWDLIRLAQAKLAGQARANTTQAERFQATLHNTEEIIGTALLPILNQYLGQLTKWLDKMNTSGQLQKDMAETAHDLAGAMRVVAKAFGIAAAAVRDYNKVASFMQQHGLGGGLVDILNRVQNKLGLKSGGLLNILGITGGGDKRRRAVAPAGVQGPLGTGPLRDTTPPPPRGPHFTRKQMNQFFDARIDRELLRAQYRSLTDQVRIYQQVAALLGKRIAITRDVTRKLKLEDQLLGVQAQIKDTRQQLREQAAEREQARREKARAEAQRRRERLIARQFGELGLGPGGEERTPGVRALRRILAGMSAALENAPAKLRSQAAKIRKVLSEAIVPEEVRAKIRDLLRDIQDELKGAEARTRFRVVSPNAILAGLGLDPRQAELLRARLEAMGPGRTLHPKQTAAFAGGGVYVAGDVNVNGVTNLRELERELTKRHAGRPRNRRGAR